MNTQDTLSRAITVADIKNFIGFTTVLVAIIFFTSQLSSDVEAVKRGVASINQKLSTHDEQTLDHEHRISRLEVIVERKAYKFDLGRQLAYARAIGAIR